VRNFVRECKFEFIIEDDIVGGAYGSNGKKRNAYRILQENPEGKRPLRKPKRRWMNKIKMDLVEIG
jgi:hypothetical protein